MNVKTFSLPANATYPHRYATWIKASPNPLIGVLEIRELKTETGKPVISRYAVKEEFAGCYRFTKSGGTDFEHVHLGHEFAECTCKGWYSHDICKHVATMQEILKNLSEVV